MNATAKYFLDILKNYNSHACVVIKNFMTGEDGSKIWHPDDKKAGIKYKKTCIIGIEDVFPIYINFSKHDDYLCRSTSFENNWNEWGVILLEFTEILKSKLLTKFFERIFTQILLAIERGNNVFIGTKMIMKKNSSYEHLMNIDMIKAVE